MGKVIAIKDATRITAGDPALQFIDECYARLAALPGFTVRPGQRELSHDICRALVSGDPIAAEAPTGTGKTIAYLVGAIAAGEKLRVTKDIPIVVATATVGLQNQVLTGDLPLLVQAGIIEAGKALLAKGRSRYFCILNAQRLVEGSSPDKQVDFFDQAGNEEAQGLEEAVELLEHWQGKAWSGDIDSFPRHAPKIWPRVAATSESCVGHKCEHYAECPFFNARRAMSSARILVANHDLVLSDLRMAAEGIDPLFPGGKYLVVFDEAHHLPDKALDVGSAELKFVSAIADLPRLTGFSKAWQKNFEYAKLLAKQKLTSVDFEPGSLINALSAAKAELDTIAVEPETGQYRFEKGVLPDRVRNALNAAHVSCTALSGAMRDATTAIKQSSLPDKNASLMPLHVELLYQAAGLNSLLSKTLNSLDLLLSEERAVRWLFREQESVSLNVCPLEGADVLRGLLWNSERVNVAMVSATLRDFDGFERYKSRVGAPSHTRTATLTPTFPYAENTLYLVDMLYSPKQENKKEFEAELCGSMPLFIDPSEGTLILFPSRSLMVRTLPALKEKFGRTVMAQGDAGIRALVKDHKDRIDRGEGSILCGLATMAEGLDLPGVYCTHVIICALPFTVPTSPVEKEQQDLLGREYFAKRALPDALVKLVQMVGRLMRRETDRGRITVFDKRIYYSKWGRKMLGALPGFRRRLVSPSDVQLSDIRAKYAHVYKKPDVAELKAG